MHREFGEAIPSQPSCHRIVTLSPDLVRELLSLMDALRTRRPRSVGHRAALVPSAAGPSPSAVLEDKRTRRLDECFPSGWGRRQSGSLASTCTILAGN